MIGEVIIRQPAKMGGGAVIYVPKKWLGFTVRCEVKRKAKTEKPPFKVAGRKEAKAGPVEKW